MCSYRSIYNSIILIHVYIYMMCVYNPGSTDPPPPPPPMVPPPPPCGVVWCGGGFLPPSLWCGGVRVCLLWFPPSPLWHGVGSGFLVVVTPCVFGSALGVWYTRPYDDDGDDDHHLHH